MRARVSNSNNISNSHSHSNNTHPNATPQHTQQPPAPAAGVACTHVGRAGVWRSGARRMRLLLGRWPCLDSDAPVLRVGVVHSPAAPDGSATTSSSPAPPDASLAPAPVAAAVSAAWKDCGGWPWGCLTGDAVSKGLAVRCSGLGHWEGRQAGVTREAVVG